MSDRDHWDAVYSSAGSTVLPWETSCEPAELAEFCHFIGPGAGVARVLEVGCGRGFNTIRLAALVGQVVAIDVSAAAVLEARARVGRAATVLEGDVLEFADAAGFDGIIDYSVFHHIPQVDWPRYVTSIARLIRPGGVFALVCYSDADVAYTNGEDSRVGDMGNVIYHPRRDDLSALFEPQFVEIEYRSTTLGEARHHAAHFMVLRKSAQGSEIT